MTETLAEAEAWDVLRDDLTRQRLCPGCAARAAWARPTGLCQTCDGTLTEQGRIVLRFVSTWTDWGAAPRPGLGTLRGGHRRRQEGADRLPPTA